MNEFTLAELGVFIGVLGGVVTSLILTVQKSKCKTVKCCGISCERQIPPPRDPVRDAPDGDGAQA